MRRSEPVVDLQRVWWLQDESVPRQRLSLFRFQTVCRRDAAVELPGDKFKACLLTT